MEDFKNLSVREQVRRMLDENIEKYPDAVRWMMEMITANPSILNKKTEYERFAARLSGKGDWIALMERARYLYPAQPSNTNHYGVWKIERIKFVRAKTSLGLKEAKDIIETYGEGDAAATQRYVEQYKLEDQEFDV